MRYTYAVLLLASSVIAFHNNNYSKNSHCNYRKLNNINDIQQISSGRLTICGNQQRPCNLEPLKAEPETIAKTVAAVGAGVFVLYSLISNYRHREDEKRKIEKELCHLDKMKQEYIRTGIDPDVRKLR
ncbi:hypothetical protein BMR1_02g03685 [Babesia microti strain RI]|uniref:Uncharacterized protein n=1 Tax=Babesia microti (strain RI) TaxID=1133968 RepID=I7J6L2_BABMR|nr:hypothetical protein BMR1_02g03685 [Babesia microti strain RI]CCF73887.1 hypothetical protein BMR1_02g03685 [Babesia microti strain RI]|eukprot:XP_012648496.1 hypothetical protein BMR1_02g03685 [Babesia microti strain RI]